MLSKKNDNEMNVHQTPPGCAVTFDGMSEIQKMADHVPPTFGEFATVLLKSTVDKTVQCGGTRADFVCDRYLYTSIKEQERMRRNHGNEEAQHLRALSAAQKTPKQFRRFLLSRKNKESLSEYLFEHWSSVSPSTLKNISLYVSHGEHCHSISASSDGESLVVLQVDNLTSDIEEADCRMLLHAKHASEQSRDVIIRSNDTDVFVLCLAFGHTFPSQLLLAFSDTTLLNIKQVHGHYGKDFCEAVCGLHAFTGCDTVSCFAGKGKVKPLALLQKTP